MSGAAHAAPAAAGSVPGALDETLISAPLSFPSPGRPPADPADLPDDATIGLRTDDLRRATAALSAEAATSGQEQGGSGPAGSERGGRAERRKAAKGGRGR
ncbi:hypothetical protein GT042_04440, partial [Streptomyces sp. SID3212]|nr:hypothetical protein [Streptomyces sp. SID3212]